MSDDDIQFLYSTAQCNQDLAQGSHKPSFFTKAKKQFAFKKTQPANDPFWFPTLETPPPHNFTPGLIPILKRILVKSHAKGLTQRAVLCYDRTVHIYRDTWDMKWGCGYRNFQMACAALMIQPVQPMYFPLLDSPSSPTVRNLQQWIENAWGDGFDEEGKKQLKALVGTEKWIGTSDLWVAFSHRGLPSELVDFNLKNEPDAGKILKWVVNYFEPPSTSTTVDQALRGASPVIITDRMPLILQHNGHSRTIIGYEINKKGVVNLLTFDPAYRVDTALRTLALAEHASSRARAAVASSSNKRRRVSSSLSVLEHTKRLKPEMEESSPATKFRVEDKMDPTDLLKPYRLDPKKVGRKSEYQILYFPLADPLTDKERLARRDPYSTKVG